MLNRNEFLRTVLAGIGATAASGCSKSPTKGAPGFTDATAATKGSVPFLPEPLLREERPVATGGAAGSLTEADLIRKLYSKIQDSFSLGENSAFPGHAFLVLCNPGIFVSPTLNLGNAVDRARLSDLLNIVPESSSTFVLQDTGVRVTAIYDQIMKNHLTALYQLSKAQKGMLKDAEKVLNNSNTMNDYFKYQLAYAIASDNLANAQASFQNGGPAVTAQLVAAHNQAKSEYQRLGHQYEVDKQQQIYDQLLGGDPAEWWSAIQQRYDNDPEKLTNVSPSYADWISGAGWEPRTMTSQDWANQFENSSTDVGGGFSAGWGLWRIGAGANYHQDQGFEHSQAKNVQLKFEVMRSIIKRDWMEPLIFRSRNWIWNQPQTDISSGGDALSGATPIGLMPFLPTGVLLARNVEMTAEFTESDRQWMNKIVDGNTSIGWGPFSFGGHYHHEEHAGSSSGSVVGSTIKTKPGDVQVLGYFCDVLPHCPEKNPALQWPTA